MWDWWLERIPTCHLFSIRPSPKLSVSLAFPTLPDGRARICTRNMMRTGTIYFLKDVVAYLVLAVKKSIERLPTFHAQIVITSSSRNGVKGRLNRFTTAITAVLNDLAHGAARYFLALVPPWLSSYQTSRTPPSSSFSMV